MPLLTESIFSLFEWILQLLLSIIGVVILGSCFGKFILQFGFIMFYSHDILKRRGRFGIIWLAATSQQRINRRDIWSVDVVKSCEDVISTLTEYTLSNQRTRARLSLYLSSQLMFGLTYVCSRQYFFLLEDLKSMFKKMGSFTTQADKPIDLDLAASVDAFRVTFEPPNMADLNPEFGRLAPLPEPSDHRSYEFFLITTPRSSEEWVITPGSPDHYRDIDPMPEGAEFLHTVQPGDITMEDVHFESEEPIPFERPGDRVDFLSGPSSFIDQAPVERTRSGPLSETIPVQPILVQQPPTPRPQQPTPPDHSFLLTPDAPIDVDQPPQPRRTVQPPPDADATTHPETPAERQRRALFDEPADTFVLPPITGTGRGRGRGRRRRSLIVDLATTLTSHEIRGGFSSANTRLTVPIEKIDPHRKPADSLLRKFSAKLVPKHIEALWRHLTTLPEPTDSDPFVITRPEEPSEVVEAVREGEGEGATAQAFEDSVELRRAGESHEATLDPSATGLLVTSSSLRAPEVSIGSLHVPGDSTIEEIPQPVAESLDDIDEPQADTTIPQPAVETSTESRERIVVRPQTPACVYSPVSPERDPPPPSHESLSSVLEETMELIRTTVAESTIVGLMTFNALIKKTDGKRKRVASLFHHLTCLHAQGKIEVMQPIPGGDIFIRVLSEGD